MARRDSDVLDPPLFPEIDAAKPKEKELLRLARAYHRTKSERDELLSTAKAKVDGAMDKVIAQMHECGIEKFKHGDLVCELVASKEKVQVKLLPDEDGEDGSDGEGDDE